MSEEIVSESNYKELVKRVGRIGKKPDKIKTKIKRNAKNVKSDVNEKKRCIERDQLECNVVPYTSSEGSEDSDTGETDEMEYLTEKNRMKEQVLKNQQYVEELKQFQIDQNFHRYLLQSDKTSEELVVIANQIFALQEIHDSYLKHMSTLMVNYVFQEENANFIKKVYSHIQGGGCKAKFPCIVEQMVRENVNKNFDNNFYKGRSEKRAEQILVDKNIDAKINELIKEFTDLCNQNKQSVKVPQVPSTECIQGDEKNEELSVLNDDEDGMMKEVVRFSGGALAGFFKLLYRFFTVFLEHGNFDSIDGIQVKQIIKELARCFV